jgi:phospholipase C
VEVFPKEATPGQSLKAHSYVDESQPGTSQAASAAIPAGIHKIKHVVIIMQENRSFDSYFGTYPGADGIPMKGGKPTVCAPDMFEPNASWSLPAHLFAVSGWSARCSVPGDPMSCRNALGKPERPPDSGAAEGHYQETGSELPPPDYAWTDLTYLLHKEGVSWAYYVSKGTQPDCANDEMFCHKVMQNPRTPGIWNPLPYFDTVRQDGQLRNIQTTSNFYKAAEAGTLPAVSWVIPGGANSEHPPALVSTGQAYVTGLINAVMRGPDWDSTAIFLTWDDWGGFYDHAVSPKVDQNGYGMRVPGLVISPYAKRGYVDHQTLSFDAYLKFVEDDFLGGQRIDPKTDGRPDPRPDVREDVPQLGDLVYDFDFYQTPRRPMILPEHPPARLGSAEERAPNPDCQSEREVQSVWGRDMVALREP